MQDKGSGHDFMGHLLRALVTITQISGAYRGGALISWFPYYGYSHNYLDFRGVNRGGGLLFHVAPITGSSQNYLISRGVYRGGLLFHSPITGSSHNYLVSRGVCRGGALISWVTYYGLQSQFLIIKEGMMGHFRNIVLVPGNKLRIWLCCLKFVTLSM